MTDGPLRRLLGLARRAAADPTDDARLLARYAAGGDADAFELLVWRHGGMVLGVCRRALGDEHAAEDAFQATFLALARQAGSVRGCVAAWLHRVARRVAVRLRASRERQRSVSVQAPVADAPGSPVDAAAHRELCQVLDQELDRLPERFRRAVVLCYLEGTTTEEAARRLGCPRGTVLSRLATARAKLRARLLRRGVAPAILPPVLSGGLIETPVGLVAPAVRAAVAGSAAPRVVELCDGVLRAMMLSKLKLTAAVVLTVGLISGGTGWMALAPGGPGSALADGPADNDAKPDRAAAERKAAEENTRRIHDELQKAETMLAQNEEKWMRERAEIRGRVIEAEERVKRLERENALKQGLARNRLEGALNYLSVVQAANAKLNDQHGNDHPETRSGQKALAAAEKQLVAAQDEYDRMDKEFSARSIEARRVLADAEDRLLLHDRMTALKRQNFQTHRDALMTHALRQHGVFGQPEAGGDRLAEIDRKLDDLKRELADLRRELRK